MGLTTMVIILYIGALLSLLPGLLFLIGSASQIHRLAIAAVFLAVSGACVGLALRLGRKRRPDPKLWIRRCQHCSWEAPLSSNTAVCERCGAPIKLERAAAEDSVGLDEE